MTQNQKKYSSADEVVRATGVQAEDLGFANNYELKQWLNDRLVEIKSLIDADRNRDYHAEVKRGERDQVPPGIEGIALRMAGNLVAHIIARQQTPVIRVDDWQVRVAEDQVFTNAIKKDLQRFPAGRRFRFHVLGSSREDN